MKLMMTYILLRDNKETGPLGFEELKRKRLKPHDLIWVEGQSVCWQNPTEINELKDLIDTGRLSQESNTGSFDEDDPVEKDNHKLGFQGVGAASHASVSSYMPVAEDEASVTPVQSQSKTAATVVAETKYSQPLDELKKLYAKNLAHKLKKKSFAIHLSPQVKKVGLYTGILAAGIIAGILINTRDTKDKASLLTNPEAVPGRSPIQSQPLQPIPADSIGIADQANSMPLKEIKKIPEENLNDKIVKQANDKKVQNSVPLPARPDQSETAEATTDKAGNKEKETSELSLNDFQSLVSVKSNDYEVGSFGGIRNLRLTVINNSKYNLDHVVVELQYLKPRDEFLKSENVSFHAIGPNDSKTIGISKSTRGVKVVFKILRIESKEAGNNTAGL